MSEPKQHIPILKDLYRQQTSVSLVQTIAKADTGHTQNIDDVPQELLAEIASHVKDIESLKSLALASRRWLAPAQRYVFTSLALRERAPPGRAGERENKSKSSSVMRVEWRSVSMGLKGPVWEES